MTQTFDPYYKWLGIPPKDQPPHHYRLLGIELYESDHDVIDAAANRVMTYLLERAAGRESPLSKKLIGEIADARACLLDRQAKESYDHQLSEKTRIMPPAPTPIDPSSDYCDSCGRRLPDEQRTCPQCGREHPPRGSQFEDTKVGMLGSASTARRSSASSPDSSVRSRSVSGTPAGQNGVGQNGVGQNGVGQNGVGQNGSNIGRPGKASSSQARSSDRGAGNRSGVHRGDSSRVLPIQDPSAATQPPVRSPKAKPPASRRNLTPYLLAACGAISIVIVVLIFMILAINRAVRETATGGAGAAADGRSDGSSAEVVDRDLASGTRLPTSSRPDNEIFAIVQDSRLDEISGLARSVKNPGMFWAHNDSGNAPEIYLINESGVTKAVCHVTQEYQRDADWEDIATFSMNGNSYVLIADIGDNDFERGRDKSRCVLHLLEEPRLDAPTSNPLLVHPEKSIEFTYSDGPHNCESVAVDAGSGTIYLATKDEKGGPCMLFRIPLSAGGYVQATKVRDLILPTIFGMDMSADGRHAVLLGKIHAYVYRRDEGESWDNAFGGTPSRIRVPSMRKGEAITFDAAGENVLITGEDPRPPIHRVRLSSGHR